MLLSTVKPLREKNIWWKQQVAGIDQQNHSQGSDVNNDTRLTNLSS